MLKIELDNETELAWQELALQQGKPSEQWLKEVISQFVQAQTHPQILPDLAEFRAKIPMQEMSAGEFCHAMRDEDRYSCNILRWFASSCPDRYTQVS